jgi:hypothetical protein
MQVIKGLVMPAATQFTYASVERGAWELAETESSLSDLESPGQVEYLTLSEYNVKAGVLNLCDGRVQRREREFHWIGAVRDEINSMTKENNSA